ncbi:MAG: hypothetical protein RQ715_05820 [Methylococcales bacterium]|nr:hypothetical protein [Methylococcales bacterium]
MKYSHKLKKLVAALALLGGSQAAHALTPWTPGNASPDVVVFTSGGAAQDSAIGLAIETSLAASGSLDIFTDSNGRFAAYYFIGGDNLTNSALRGRKIVLVKRSRGAAGYGVVPLLGGIPLDHLDILKSGANVESAWTNSINSNGVPVHEVTLSSANASTYLTQRVSDGGFLGIDAAALLAPGTENYPDPVTELTTGQPTANWQFDLTPENLNQVDIIPTGGLVYGVGVTEDLYKVLQLADIVLGKLPTSVPIGAYDEASLPSLNRNFIAALLSGQIADWSDVKVFAPNLNASVSLDDPVVIDFLNSIGVSISAPTDYRVAVGRRNTGAAVGAVAHAKYLNYPFVTGSFPPANPTPAANDATAKPIVKAPGGTSATGRLLTDWQTGSNTSSFNNAGARYWGVAINSAVVNTGVRADGTGGQPWRYVKIDGYAPTIENVAAGTYPVWAEGEVLVRKDLTPDKFDLLSDFANALGSSVTARLVNTGLRQAWGQTGIFATTRTDPSAVPEVPFNVNNPVVGLNHGGLLGVAPTPFNNGASAGNIIQLK